VQTVEGQAIAAVHDDPSDGMTHLFVLERGRGANAFRVRQRMPLDVEGFRGAEWKTEVLDLDGDGYDEVLCTGRGAREEEAGGSRYVVYAPRTHQTYSLHVAPDASEAKSMRATWSPNTQGEQARLFRHALRQRAYSATRTL